MGSTAEDVASQTATPEDVNTAVANTDPDTIPAGGVQATSTEEAHQQARKFLNRVGQRDTEVADLKGKIEANAQASRDALKRAQQVLLNNYGAVNMPSERENAESLAAAVMRPTPGVGMNGALLSQGANWQAEMARQDAQRRQALAGYLSQASGLPLQEALSKINEQTYGPLTKLLEMQQRQDTDLGKASMTALGRVAANPAAVAANKPNSTFGKQALDELGPAAYKVPGDPSQGFSDAFRSRVQTLNQAAIDEAKARAGIDAHPVSPDEKLANANLAGVPIAAPGLPNVDGMSTQQRKQFLASETKNIEKQTADNGTADEQIRAALRSLDDFNMRNKTTYTGPWNAPFVLGGVHAGPHGVGADLTQERGGANLNLYSVIHGYDSNVQEMQKDAANVIGQAIPAKGFGRVTNRDLGLFQQGSIGVDKNQQTNDEVSQALRIRLNNDLNRHQFETAYAGIHNTLRGSENAWNQYLNDNPIFDPKYDPHSPVYDPKAPPIKPGGVVPLNPNRQEWGEYFRGKNPKPLQSAPVETLDTHEPPLTREQLHGVDPDDPILEGLTNAEKQAYTTPAQARGGRVGMAEGGEPPPAEPDPEIQAGLKALANGLTFRAAGIPESSDTPGTNFLGEAAGAGTTAALGLMALRQPARAAKFLAEHPTLTSSLLGGAAGATSGGMSGGDPVASGIMGAAAGPMVRRGIAGGADVALNRLREQIDPGTQRAIGAIEKDTGGDWDKVAAQLQADAKLKVPSILGEVGPRSVGLTRAAIGRDVPESNELLGDMQARQADAPNRVSDQVNQAMAPDNYLAKTQELRDSLYTKAAPLYDQAFAQFPSVNSQAISNIMQTPSGQEAVMRARKMMADQQIPEGQPGQNSVSLQFLDQVKRSLDDMILSEEGSGATYQATQQGRVLRKMRSDLVSELDKSTMGPQGQPSPYRAARDQYAGDLDIMDALRTGRESFDKFTPDEVRQLMQKLDYSSRDAFRSGVAEGIFQKIGTMGPNANSAQAVIGNPNLQQKIAATFDDPKQAQRFIDALTRESAVFQSGKALNATGMQGLATSMQPTSLLKMAKSQMMMPSTAGQVSGVMGTGARDPDMLEKINRLRAQADQLRSNKGVSNLIGNAGMTGAIAGSAPGMLSQGQ